MFFKEDSDENSDMCVTMNVWLPKSGKLILSGEIPATHMQGYFKVGNEDNQITVSPGTCILRSLHDIRTVQA